MRMAANCMPSTADPRDEHGTMNTEHGTGPEDRSAFRVLRSVFSCYHSAPVTLAFDKDESHPMVDALLRTRVPRWRELNRAIDERDDMLDFAMKLFHHDRDAAVTNYFQNALDQFALVRHVAAWREKHPRRMLDFASGYGRLTRLLVHEHLADEITVADILEGGDGLSGGAVRGQDSSSPRRTRPNSRRRNATT